MSALPFVLIFTSIVNAMFLVIESLINYIPNQDDIETENCTNTNVAKNGY